MKDFSPKKIAFLFALAAALLLSICCTFLWLLFHPFLLWFSLSVFLLSLLICYLAIFFIVKKVLEKRLKLIYRTIHRAKVGLKGDSKNLDMNTDVFGEIHKEVIEWDKNNKSQIQRLTEQEAFRREFLGNVSHELKTPIFSIQGYILTLLEGGLEDKKVNRKFLKKAEKSVNRMIEMVEDLDEISRLEHNKLQLQISVFDIVALTAEVMDSLELEAKKKKVKLICSSKGKEIFVKADQRKITQVLTNLLVNSIHYSNKELGETKVKFFDMGENVLLEVQDSGSGIAKEHLERVFERFYRIDKSRSRKEGGTGLGLSIVKHILEAHKQTISVRSLLGKGSVFSFTLRKA